MFVQTLSMTPLRIPGIHMLLVMMNQHLLFVDLMDICLDTDFHIVLDYVLRTWSNIDTAVTVTVVGTVLVNHHLLI